jgi:hypothetical protein
MATWCCDFSRQTKTGGRTSIVSFGVSDWNIETYLTEIAHAFLRFKTERPETHLALGDEIYT